MRKEYYRKVRLILESELNGINKMKAINTLPVPVVAYSFIIILNRSLMTLNDWTLRPEKFLPT